MKWDYKKNRGHTLEISTRWWLGTLALGLLAWQGPDVLPGLSTILPLVVAAWKNG